MAKEVFNFSGKDAEDYESYLGPVLFEPSAKEIFAFVGPSDIQSVLEISCGTGRLTRHLREYFPLPANLIATDISPDMLSVAKETLNDPSITFNRADAQELPYEDESFDIVLCQYGLMFLPDRLKGFKEAIRVLRPGGRFLFSTWDDTSNIPMFKLVFNDLIIPFFKDDDVSRIVVPFSLHQPSKLLEYFKQSGFKNSKVTPVEFESHSTSIKNIIKGFLLNNPIGRNIAEKDPAALPAMADELEQRLSQQYQETEICFSLKAFIGIGEK